MVTISGKDVVLDACSDLAPLIYVNTMPEEDEALRAALGAPQTRPFHLVCIQGLNWQRDLSPWPAPALSKKSAPFAGKADAYLQTLTQEVLPQLEQELSGKILWRGIAGYSLAGLFALYAALESQAFTRVASVSGSLWFPGVVEYVQKAQPGALARCYISLGEREHKSRSPLLRQGREAAEDIVACLQKKGVQTTFVTHPGGHFQDVTARTVAALRWLTEENVCRM